MDNGDPAGAVPHAVASTVTFVSRSAWLSLSHSANTGFIGCGCNHPPHALAPFAVLILSGETSSQLTHVISLCVGVGSG